MLEALSEDPHVRDALSLQARETFGLTKTALSTNDIPLPTTYSAEIVALVSQFVSSPPAS